MDVDAISASLWRVIETLKIVANATPLVAGSKTLHHLLPELVPPMDRAYTQQFFGWNTHHFQHHQRRCFESAFAAFVLIASQVDAQHYVGTGVWNTSVTKVLDNGVVGYLCAVRDDVVTSGGM